MEVTEVRVKLASERDDDRLIAYCSITLDRVLVIRDLRVVEGSRGQPVVSMPSRKISDNCPTCRAKNPLRARYCNECGDPLDDGRGFAAEDGRIKYYADVAHPICQEFRRQLEDAVLNAVGQEQDRYEQGSA